MAHHASATALKSKCPEDGTASLCANGCGFYGAAATGNMCSKCYKEHAVAASNTTAKKSVFVPEVSTAPPENKAKTSVFVPEVSTAPPENKAKTIVSDTSSDGGEPSMASTKQQPIAATNRCATCRKKVGLLGFRCRCEGTFCSVHRYSDKHDCGFDYKTAGREQIVKNNPIVLADKMATRI